MALRTPDALTLWYAQQLALHNERNVVIKETAEEGVEDPPLRAVVGLEKIETVYGGMRLHISPTSGSGYLHVFPSGKHYAARLRIDGQLETLGSFDTAADAAHAVAVRIGEADPQFTVEEAEAEAAKEKLGLRRLSLIHI